MTVAITIAGILCVLGIYATAEYAKLRWKRLLFISCVVGYGFSARFLGEMRGEERGKAGCEDR